MNSEYEGIVQKATERLRETVVADTQVGEEGCEYFARDVLKAAGVEEALQAAEERTFNLEEVLAFYSDKKKWKSGWIDDDGGRRAREALSDTADVEGKS